jgi:hypothetical protein
LPVGEISTAWIRFTFSEVSRTIFELAPGVSFIGGE